MVISEAVNSYIANELKSINKNLNIITDEPNAVKGHNTYVDSSNLMLLSDQMYAKKFIELCKKFSKYENKIILVNLKDWCEKYKEPTKSGKLAALLKYIRSTPDTFKKELAGFVFIFVNENNEGISLEVDKFNSSQVPKLVEGINILTKTTPVKSVTTTNSNPNDKINKANNASKDPVKKPDTSKEDKKATEKKKKELVSAIAKAAEESESEEELIDKIDTDETIAQILNDLDDERGAAKISASRAARMDKNNEEFKKTSYSGRTVKDILEDKTEKEIPESSIKVHSINDEWNHLKFINFEKAYDLDADILKVIMAFTDKQTKTYPVSVLDISVEDTSTSMDYLYTYTVKMEDTFGKRFSLVFDIPKLRNNKFFRLRGNDKVINGQLVLLPCTKTGQDVAQLVSNYSKIFIYRHGTVGRSYGVSDRLVKSLRKLATKGNDKNIKIYFGDNRKICDKYDLPIDYIDIASNINRIETPTSVYYFNQDVYVNMFNYESIKGTPYAVNKFDNSIRYYKPKNPGEITIESDIDLVSVIIAKELSYQSEEFKKLYASTKAANRLSYAEASVMSSKMPVAVVLGYYVGLENMLMLINGKGTKRYEFKDKKENINIERFSIIKLQDTNLVYRSDPDLCMILNGLNECDIEDYSSTEMNKKSTWLDLLDKFGGRLLSDGLDNFRDLFVDPITSEVCDHQGYHNASCISLLIEGSKMLADTKYIKHTDISGNRYRSNELIAGYLYKCLATSYGEYYTGIKRGRKNGMSIKRSAIVDAIMKDPTFSDLSILNPLLELEKSNEVSFKGLTGMNEERSYSLDKRTYDKSMEGKIALSTGFAGNVGINRQTTIDMGIEGTRGYIKPNSEDDEASVTSNFSVAEAITPFGTTSDDPFRSAMNFIQTAKHSMRTAKSFPLLISNGTDEAMPYMSSDTYVVKALADGFVKELNEEYMLLEYNSEILIDKQNHKTQYVNLKEEVKKNSDGGFYITVKLDTDLHVGDKFKDGDIVAYDKSSYSNKNGEADYLAYNLGTLAKIAILNTDEGYEDSTTVSDWLSGAMASDVVTCEPYTFSKSTNVYNVKKVGDPIQEGEALLIMQNAFDDEDANALLKYITGDKSFVSDLGRIRLKSKFTGVVQDIKIYRTCEIEEMSESLAKLVTEYEKGIKNKREIYKNNNLPGENTLDPDFKMRAEGKLKNVVDGVMIEFYIKYHDKLSVGDKIVAQSANKGVVRSIFPEGNEPFSEYRQDEKIHALFASRSFNARMVFSVIRSAAINKCLIELDRKVKDIMGLEAPSIEDIQ